MTLPKIDVPVYDVLIPSSGQPLKVRPFNVKEEKLLFMAVEAGKPDDIVSTVKQVINNCIIEGEIDIDKCPFFDVDFLFIFLRAKSIGESVDVKMTCHAVNDKGDKCGHTFPTSMDISKCEIVRVEGLSNKIALDADKGVKMKYPTYALIKQLEANSTDIDKKTTIIINSIECIYDQRGVYPAKDYSTKELKDFVENLTEENYKKLENFVNNFPVFVVNLEADCPKCGFHHHVRYSDFEDFFY